jgi:hypothetical protein
MRGTLKNKEMNKAERPYDTVPQNRIRSGLPTQTERGYTRKYTQKEPQSVRLQTNKVNRI